MRMGSAPTDGILPRPTMIDPMPPAPETTAPANAPDRITGNVPFHRACNLGRETEYVLQASAAGAIAGNQRFTRACQDLLADTLGVRHALLTTSCTHALEMAAMLLDIRPGDEVILPSFTFVSTANAFVLRGATPVFCDVRPDTLNLDENRVEALVTPRTRAIVPVHYAGVACEMDAINAIAARHGIAVVEDNAHGLFGRYKGRWLGTLGTMSTSSFHETKNITCGEGGALLVNDDAMASRAEILREKGTNRARFLMGQVDKYSWVDIGSSYVLSDMLAAHLYGQLEQWRATQQRRERVWRAYQAQLADWARATGTAQPVVPAECDSAWHAYFLLLPTREARTAFLAHMRAAGIGCVFHYLPLNRSDFAQALPRRFECPVTEDVSARLARLPLYHALDDAQQQRVVETALRFRP